MDSPTLKNCHIWHDTTPRSGAINMAIDQLLLESVTDTTLLRFYDWSQPSVSFGYFERLASAMTSFPDEELEYIRRWTGGGIVDHRPDITYSLVIPRSHSWANLRGAESYRIIHQAVANALIATGTPCQLTSESHQLSAKDKSNCFTNPVEYDITCPLGNKLAGAGQKRSKLGLLHQGSVIGVKDSSAWKEQLIRMLATSHQRWSPKVKFYKAAEELAYSRYASTEWTAKRP